MRSLIVALTVAAVEALGEREVLNVAELCEAVLQVNESGDIARRGDGDGEDVEGLCAHSEVVVHQTVVRLHQLPREHVVHQRTVLLLVHQPLQVRQPLDRLSITLIVQPIRLVNLKHPAMSN